MKLTPEQLDDFESLPLEERTKAGLRFLKQTHGPADKVDLDAAVRNAVGSGLSADALRGAAAVAFVFDHWSFIADALGWDVPNMEFFRSRAAFHSSRAKMILSVGYKMP